MWFVLFATANPEEYGDLLHILEHTRLPEGVKVHRKLKIFGKPDVVVVFEARDEQSAEEFVKQFGRVSDVRTHLAINVGGYE
ncbi:MAG: hypothetical protein GXO25_08420 [Euryarchaeota archaeon]|nr:hypothetical protein [Euryarchaeota archaeon]